jgi:phage terminase large subunit-like protein
MLEQLENQMCGWQPGQPSPDRIDALVWALTDLMLAKEEPVGSIFAYL